MHYVKQFHINGVDTKQVACIELHGKPNAATEGYVGVLGIDMDSPTHEVYKCVAVNGAIYTWELLSSGLSMISSTLTSGGVEFMQFPYDRLQTPSLYMVKIGDLILDRYGYLYQVTALYSSYCDATYCGTQIVAHCPSGVYCGSETPPAGVDVWVDPSGETSETEDWVFTLEDGSTITKRQLLIDAQLNILRLKDADGNWGEIPVIKGDKGDPFTYDDFTPEQLAALKGEPGQAGSDASVTSENITAALGYAPANEVHEHSAEDITSGALSLARGGTGAELSYRVNAIVRFSTNGGKMSSTATANGAFYATEANGAAKFGTLPIAQGGTGATDAATARTNLGLKTENWTFALESGDTVTKEVYVK